MPKEKNSGSADRELYITKLLNAPVALVWEVWTDPDHIAKWWGPHGFTNSIDKMEFKPGGSWEFVMHGPDGRNYKNRNVFTEIVKHKRIVFEHVSAPKHITTVTFTAEGEKTRVTWHMLFESKEQFEHTVKTFKADEGLKQNLEKLATYLTGMQGKHIE